MGRITRLSTELSNQIAAGEVVERPASVVKELVENALDAGSTRVVVYVELGGKKRVRVEDDGEGMEPDDARLALERHATSKIARVDDLSAIATLGFRGEALPSIASVARFVLRTRRHGAVSGTEIRVNGGVIASVTEAAAAEGTAVEVNDLFYNLPARRKFLKSDAAESAQVSRIVTQLALAHPDVGFTLTSAGRMVLQCPPVARLRDRVYQLYGERDDLVEIGKEVGGLRVTGYVAALAAGPLGGPARGPQNIFVNRRIVKDRTIAHAIVAAYSTASIKERSPEVHVFLEMPLDALDVNVHPTKAEVRFRDQSFVHEVVRRALMEGLGQGSAPPLFFRPEATGGPSAVAVGLPGVVSSMLGSAGGPGRWAPRPDLGGLPSFAAGSSAATAVADVLPMLPLGQFRDTFIIAIDADGISIIDQHVAHERVLFERVMARLTTGRLESQRLLVPLVLDLPAAAHQALVGRSAELGQLGFEVEAFGATAVKVSAVPALLRASDSSTALLALAEDLEGLDRGAHVHDALSRLAATTACHAAVKANDPLTFEKMAHILDELRATAYSTVCPHGRPVMLRLTRREIEKNFERV